LLAFQQSFPATTEKVFLRSTVKRVVSLRK